MANLKHLKLVPILLASAAVGSGCTFKVEDQPAPNSVLPVETRVFTGDVYDGVTGAHVTDYDIAVDFAGQYIRGTKDARGGFHLPPIPALQDFAVYIDSPGFRPFVAHQAQWLDAVHGDRSFYYLAYLFADKVPVEDVPVLVTLRNGTDLPSGSLRLRPTALSAVYDDPVEQPAAIPGQLWQNDNDLLSKTVWVDFTEGKATVAGTDLVYGVPYQVSVFNVPGYQLFQGSVFQAGVNSKVTLQLDRLTVPRLAVSYISTQSGDPSPDGTVTIVLNEPAEYDPLEMPLDIKNAIDDGFSIFSPDTNNNLQRNILKINTDPNVQARGTSIALSGQSIVLKWDRSTGLQSQDPGDRINSITYGGLSAVRLRPTGGNASDVVTLASIVGATSISVVLTP
jgi:hypothetical protein